MTLPDMQPFDPAANPQAFRRALGRYATGVTVITALEAGAPIGITANSFASLSLDPALVLWSPAKPSSRHDAFVRAEYFNIHVLGEDQQAICDGFVRARDSFDGLSVTHTAEGVPLIAGCLAVFQCRTFARHDAGDHTLILGEVLRASEQTGAPLLFANGQFGGANLHF